MFAEPPDPNYDPERWLLDYRPAEPERTILCTCGATLALSGRGETECGCGRIWNRFGRLVATVWPPRQP